MYKLSKQHGLYKSCGQLLFFSNVIELGLGRRRRLSLGIFQLIKEHHKRKVDMELDDPEIGDPEMGDQEMGDVVDMELDDPEIGDPEMGDQEMGDVEMVYPVIDPPALDISPVAMDIDPVDEHYRQYMGVEDFGRLISSGVSSSRFCSSKYMTPSGNQMHLDSCVSWTLSAALGALAGLTYNIQNAPVFSTQEMVDCHPITPGGIRYEEGYGYVMFDGLHKKENYPDMYKYNLPCRCHELQGLPKGSFVDYDNLFCPYDILMELSNRPLTAGISFVHHTAQCVSVDDLMGVYSPLEGEQPICGDDGKILNHAVLVIGYDIEDNEPFFIIKNWSGVAWGVNGYARVAARLLFCFAFPYSYIEIPPW